MFLKKIKELIVEKVAQIVFQEYYNDDVKGSLGYNLFCWKLKTENIVMK